MRQKDTSDAMNSLLAIVSDAAALMGSFLLATWLRFDSHWARQQGTFLYLDPVKGRPEDLYFMYGLGGVIGTVIILFIFRSSQLYSRPQIGTFGNKIPKIIRAVTLGFVVITALGFAARTEPPFSRLTMALGYALGIFTILLVRWIMFRIEWNLARHSAPGVHVLILGTGPIAANLRRGLKKEPMLRAEVSGFLRTTTDPSETEIDDHDIVGDLSDLERILAEGQITKVILTDAEIGHSRTVDILLQCERRMVTFNMVPDLFHILTSSIDVHAVDDIPLVGVSALPLDNFWNRMLKRAEDIVGSLVGLLLSSIVILIVAPIIKLGSKGPLFYRQTRCGENGKNFTIYKLRTMPVDAEDTSGPVWTQENDNRRTGVGAWLRAYNLDELPQFWNVLTGEMSLVGPRPERPHFVDQFKEDIRGYMSRHASKPGITGWAQVNGLRGNTSIQDRIKYDLFYLENWSLALDFKILFKTFLTRKNAY